MFNTQSSILNAEVKTNAEPARGTFSGIFLCIHLDIED